jgi:hypothetical protein
MGYLSALAESGLKAGTLRSSLIRFFRFFRTSEGP